MLIFSGGIRKAFFSKADGIIIDHLPGPCGPVYFLVLYMRDQIRVLYFYPYLNYDTGSPKAMVQVIEALDRAMFQPVYCAAGEGPLVNVLRARGVEIVSGKVSDISFRHPIAAAAAIRQQTALLKLWDIDLLHANCFPWNTDLILAAWMLRVPVILHVHNAMDIVAHNLVRFAANKVLFCSGFQMANSGHVYRVAGKAEVFHNVIDLAAFSGGHSIRETLGLRADEIAIGTVAQVAYRKGIDILLETASILLRERNDLVFLIAGPMATSEEEFGRRLMVAAQEGPLRGRVRFLGSRADIADFLASLDLFVLPSRVEPMGIVVLEAMAAALPVIASKVGGIPEMLTSPEIGTLVDPVTPEAFAAAFRGVLALPDRGRSMGEKGKLTLPGQFDLATGGTRLKNLYLEVLSVPEHSEGSLRRRM